MPFQINSTDSEEFECEPPNNFSCGDGKCIPPKWVCDHRHDCDNKLDEENCPSTCKDDEFYCGDDQCISNRWVCDNEIDCRSRLDELSCDDGVVSDCDEDEMNCGNGDCIKLGWKCDGEEDCSNGEDERECDVVAATHCKPKEFRCNNGDCIPVRWRCDDSIDCGDGSDEHRCGVPDVNITTNDTTLVGQTETTDELTTFQEMTTPLLTTPVSRRRRPNSRRNNRKRLTTPPSTFDPYTWEGSEEKVDNREEKKRARKEKKKQAAAEKEANKKPGSDVNEEAFNKEQMEEARTTPAIVGVQSSSVSTRHTLAVILGISVGFLVITVLLSLTEVLNFIINNNNAFAILLGATWILFLSFFLSSNAHYYLCLISRHQYFGSVSNCPFNFIEASLDFLHGPITLFREINILLRQILSVYSFSLSHFSSFLKHKTNFSSGSPRLLLLSLFLITCRF
ncbi:LRP1B [Acanthosepion pharaonis]|uniref:LRP1B n=1 Tax=Acanthosepion pharaonis TaxID=158019 RepID=A0A812DHU9_ACAPH|nr:LRP1B [Sepia pharaonis]